MNAEPISDPAIRAIADRAAGPGPAPELPDEEQLIRWLSDEEEPEALDGCIVEPDGSCEHGSPSWLRKLGLV